MFITDHNVQETLRIPDRAYVVSSGETIAAGTAVNILENEKVRKVYLGESFKPLRYTKNIKREIKMKQFLSQTISESQYDS